MDLEGISWSRIDPNLEKIAFIWSLLILISSGLIFSDLDWYSLEWTRIFYAHLILISSGLIFFWSWLIQPWVDQNFLVSIDPNLEWTRNFLDPNPSSVYERPMKAHEHDPSLTVTVTVQYRYRYNTGPHGLDMDWSRLSMKKHENLAFFGLFWPFQSMCNPCAHGSWPEFWEKSIPPQSMKIFFPNPCTVSKNEFFSAKIHVQYMSQKITRS